jgi:hypothetical protein
VWAVWQHSREAVVCFGLEEAVWFKCDFRWTSGGQSILENGGSSAKGDAV